MPSKLQVIVDTQVKGLDKLEGLGGKLQRTGANLTKFATLPLLAAGTAAFKFASDADEASSKAERVFGDAFDSIASDAANMNDAFSEAQFLDAAGTFGQMAQGMGFAQDESAALSKQWLGMAQDFASFNNLDVADTLDAIRSGISGEMEPLKRLGVVLNQATIEAKAMELGLWDGTAAIDAQAKAAAVTALITEKMGAAQGDFAATSEGAANSTRILAGNMVDLAADLGTQLLPVGIAILTFLKNLLTGFQNLPEPVKALIVPIAGLVAAIGPVVFVGGKLVSSFNSIKGAFMALKVVMLANPFVALAAAVIAIAALIILNWDKITEFLRKAWNFIIGGVLAFADRLRSVWETITGAVSTAWNGIIGIIKGVINGIITAINAFIGFINGIQIHIPAIGVGPFQTPAFDWWGLGIPTIPQLAEGGIITAPTLALLGERGPEAVVPLDKAWGETHFHSHIEVRGEDPFIRNPEDLVRINQRIAFLEGF